MFSVSINIDPDKLKDAVKKNQGKKKRSNKAKKSRAEKLEDTSKNPQA